MKTFKSSAPIILFFVLFLAGTFVMKYLQNSLRGTTMILGVDMVPRWVGTQAVLQGESPYSQIGRAHV